MKRILLLVYLSLISFITRSQVAPPAPYTNNSGVNSVRVWVASAPAATVNELKGRDLRYVTEAATFTDGFGRVIQTVTKKGSYATGGAAADLVSAYVYDSFGLLSRAYLPFVANTTGGNASVNDGGFKLNPFQQQAAFYTGSGSPLAGQGETFFYSEMRRERSPFSTSKKELAPGNSWVGAGRGKTTAAYFNTVADSVVMWKVSDSVTSHGLAKYYPDPYSTTNVTPYYPAGYLVKSVSTNENGKQTIFYTNKEGYLVLKKVQHTANADNGQGGGHTGWLCTYYIYDNYGSLHCIIQPEGVRLLQAQGWKVSEVITAGDIAMANSEVLNSLSYAGSNNTGWGGVLNEQCFRYQYDAMGRVVREKRPGAGEVVTVYDKRGRLVMSQDARMRLLHKWVYRTYDAFNRMVSTGLLTDELHYADLDYHIAGASNSSSYPNLSAYVVEELSKTGYDTYNDFPATAAGFSAQFDNSYAAHLISSTGAPQYADLVSASGNTKGLATWVRSKVVGGDAGSYLYSVTIYDEKQRPIQVKSTNITGGTDIITKQYNWEGSVLMAVARIQRSQASGEVTTIVTKNTYDDLGRLVNIEEKASNPRVNGGAMPNNFTLLNSFTYDALGVLKKKQLGPGAAQGGGDLETMNYDYNIRGWLLGVNRDYTRDANNTNSFGFDLGYDKGQNNLIGNQAYTNPTYNGNIAGMVWKSKGDGEKRKYDFTYDASNRLLAADFNQFSGSVFDKSAGVNYSVKMGNGIHPDSAYDGNGNIRSMQQYGLKGNASPVIDQLRYAYANGTSRLLKVTDAINDPTSKLGDFKQGTLPGDDYAYDVNGNLILDQQKNITEIVYNHLDLPQKIRFVFPQGSGTIQYAYSPSGAKLKKTVTDSSVNPVKVSTTVYLGGIIYQNDSLQSIGHTEGRFRLSKADTGRFVSDYFVRDHLGNVRMVLTDEVKQSSYPAATMETASSTTENQLYSNLNETRTDKPDGYPVDNSVPGANNKVAILSGGDKKIGPGIVLKVMSGDRFNVRLSSWYKQNSVTPGAPVNPLQPLLAALAGGTAIASGGKYAANQLLSNNYFDPAAIQFLNTQSGTDTSKPKAFLNWILFDEQFKFVSASSGFEQVGNNEELKQHIKPGLPITRNGYLYIYASNETPNINVYFDNLQVTHLHGPLQEESHYYPFGLAMAGISSQAFGMLENRYKFNAGSELNKDLGLDLYETSFRSYNPLIGRFLQQDPLADKSHNWSAYAFGMNNPVSYSDPLGLDTITNPFDPGKDLETGDVFMWGGKFFVYHAGTGKWFPWEAAPYGKEVPEKLPSAGEKARNAIAQGMKEIDEKVAKYNQKKLLEDKRKFEAAEKARHAALEKAKAEGEKLGKIYNNLKIPGIYDNNKVDATLTGNARISSPGSGARLVRLALEVGGLNSGNPVAAAGYGTFLTKKGFADIKPKNHKPVISDIAAFERFAGHEWWAFPNFQWLSMAVGF